MCPGEFIARPGAEIYVARADSNTPGNHGKTFPAAQDRPAWDQMFAKLPISARRASLKMTTTAASKNLRYERPVRMAGSGRPVRRWAPRANIFWRTHHSPGSKSPPNGRVPIKTTAKITGKNSHHVRPTRDQIPSKLPKSAAWASVRTTAPLVEKEKIFRCGRPEQSSTRKQRPVARADAKTTATMTGKILRHDQPTQAQTLAKWPKFVARSSVKATVNRPPKGRDSPHGR